MGSPVQESQEQLMPQAHIRVLMAELLAQRRQQVLDAWRVRGRHLAGSGAADELQRDGAAVLDALRDAFSEGDGVLDLAPVRGLLGDFSSRRARSGDRPAQTAGLVLALREAMLAELAGTSNPDDRSA